MKKLLIGTIILSVFSIALVITQMSCTKQTMAQGPGLIQPLNKILFTRDTRGASSEIWISNPDGTGLQQVPVALPAGAMVSEQVRLSADGKTVIFVTMDEQENTTGIYSCAIDGSGVKKMIEGTTELNKRVTLQGTY